MKVSKMTAEEFLAAMKRLALVDEKMPSQWNKAADALGVDPRTVRRWVYGEIDVPRRTAALIRAWLKVSPPGSTA